MEESLKQPDTNKKLNNPSHEFNEEEMAFLNLIAQIIVEISIRQANEIYRKNNGEVVGEIK
ncbi:MAG: hypothetical protein QM802_11935 [Agriterribacter sp.]